MTLDITRPFADAQDDRKDRFWDSFAAPPAFRIPAICRFAGGRPASPGIGDAASQGNAGGGGSAYNLGEPEVRPGMPGEYKVRPYKWHSQGQEM